MDILRDVNVINAMKKRTVNQKNRYMIGSIECFVEFFKPEMNDMKHFCTLYIKGKEFLVRIELLELIAKPAP